MYIFGTFCYAAHLTTANQNKIRRVYLVSV